MRQQQNRRAKGRGNQNKKFQNPLTKIYDSTGPGVKIRGNAQHIYDKYMALARDARTSGDYISAENFIQHAEHYHRIILDANKVNDSHRNEKQVEEIEIEAETEELSEINTDDSIKQEETVAEAKPKKRTNRRTKRVSQVKHPQLQETETEAELSVTKNTDTEPVSESE